MSDPEYCYPPDFTTLRNKLGLHDAETLDRFERRSAAQRMAQGVPLGDFDLPHLRAIHRHLFQDVYDWAGELRAIEIAKGGNQFQFRRYIATGMADVHKRIVAGGYLRNLTPTRFAQAAAEIIGDINYCHPFREGNGRTLTLYLAQFSAQAGHPLDLRHVDEHEWIEASKAAHAARYERMSACLETAIEATRNQSR